MAFEKMKALLGLKKLNRDTLCRELDLYLARNYRPEDETVLVAERMPMAKATPVAERMPMAGAKQVTGGMGHQSFLRSGFSKTKSTHKKTKADKCEDAVILCEDSCEEAQEIMGTPMLQAPFFFDEKQEDALNERMQHMEDSFASYLLYLIENKGMKNSEVYHRALVDKKTFSKLKNNPEYHPNKMTAMCLCVGAMLNLDETKDLLARAGYALSPCNKADIIFSFFIENEIYDIYEIDIQLEEHGLEPLVDEDKIFD